MQKKKIFVTALLALAGLGSALTNASASTTLSYTKDDLFLAFRSDSDPGSSLSYLVDIGQASLYRDATGAFTLNIGDINADLSATFGSSWSSRSDVYWSVFGGNSGASTVGGDSQRTIYASSPELVFGTTAEAWTINSLNGQASPANKMNQIGNAYASVSGVPNTSTSHSDVGFIQANSALNSYYSVEGPGHTNSFGYFASGIEGTFANGAAGSALDLFRLVPSPAGGAVGDAGSFEGRFTITSGGSVTFTPTAVPEPSTYGLAIAAFAVLVAVARRSRTARQS